MASKEILLTEFDINQLRAGSAVVLGDIQVGLTLEGFDPYVPEWARQVPVSNRDLADVLAGSPVAVTGELWLRAASS